MKSTKIKRVMIFLLLMTCAVSLVGSYCLAQGVTQPQKRANLSKGRTLGIGAPLPSPMGAYLVWWLDDTYGITGSGYLYGNFFSASGSLLYKFKDDPQLDYLLYGSVSYRAMAWKMTFLGLGAGVGLEYSVFRFLAFTVTAEVSLGLAPQISIVPGMGGGIVFYFM